MIFRNWRLRGDAIRVPMDKVANCIWQFGRTVYQNCDKVWETTREVEDPGTVQQDATLVPHQALSGGRGSFQKPDGEN